MSEQIDRFVIVIIVVAVFLGVWWIKNQTKYDNFTTSPAVIGHPCRCNNDCNPGEFCYMGQCWGYWKGNPMPWSTCHNPYADNNSTDCSNGQCNCLPYCKCEFNRRLGHTIGLNCFPKCGAPCSDDGDCPPGCPSCTHGICSAPSQ